MDQAIATETIGSPKDVVSLPMRNLEQREQFEKSIFSPILRWETRILALHPGQRHDDLAGDLLTAALTYHDTGLGLTSEDRLIEYEALSYTWEP